MYSWFAANASRPSSSHPRSIRSTTSRGSETAPTVYTRDSSYTYRRRTPGAAGSRSPRQNQWRGDPAARVALRRSPEEVARADGPVRLSVERPRLAEAPRDLRLPRDDPQRREVRPDCEVDIALLPTDDGGVAEVGAHHRTAERDPFTGHPGEVTERDVLPARDAVEIGVQQPDRPEPGRIEGGERR